MGYSFRPAVRKNTALIISLTGASGSGKTFTAMEIATGLAYPGMTDEEIHAAFEKEGRYRVAFIDTERGRALHYAPPGGQRVNRRQGWFPFDTCELEPPFRPATYSDAIKSAERAGYLVIVVDSCSHEWAGEGGVLGYQGEEQYKLASRWLKEGETPSWKDLEKVKAASWIKPKGEHNEFIGVLTTRKAHVICCLRAKQVVEIREEVVNGKKKTVWVAAKDRPINERWTPICHEDFPYEMTMSFLLTPDRPGFAIPLKLQEQHRPFVDLERPLSIETGAALAEWSAGAVSPAGGRQESTSGGGGKRTPEEMVDAYCNRLKAAPTIGALLEIQQEPRTAAWLLKLKDSNPGLHSRAVEAGSRRVAELNDDDAGDDQRQGNDDWPDDMLTGLQPAGDDDDA